MNTPDGSGLTILGHATTEGDLLEVQRMLALDACDVNCSDPTPLAIAIEQIYILRPHTYLGLRQFQQCRTCQTCQTAFELSAPDGGVRLGGRFLVVVVVVVVGYF